MAYKRRQVESLEIAVNSGTKKYVRYNEGADLYSMGIHGFTDLAKEAGAVRKINPAYKDTDGTCAFRTFVKVYTKDPARKATNSECGQSKYIGYKRNIIA